MQGRGTAYDNFSESATAFVAPPCNETRTVTFNNQDYIETTTVNTGTNAYATVSGNADATRIRVKLDRSAVARNYNTYYGLTANTLSPPKGYVLFVVPVEALSPRNGEPVSYTDPDAIAYYCCFPVDDSGSNLYFNTDQLTLSSPKVEQWLSRQYPYQPMPFDTGEELFTRVETANEFAAMGWGADDFSSTNGINYHLSQYDVLDMKDNSLSDLKLDDYETSYRSSFWFHNTYSSIVNRGGMEDNYVDGSIPREATFDINRSQFGTCGDFIYQDGNFPATSLVSEEIDTVGTSGDCVPGLESRYRIASIKVHRYERLVAFGATIPAAEFVVKKWEFNIVNTASANAYKNAVTTGMEAAYLSGQLFNGLSVFRRRQVDPRCLAIIPGRSDTGIESGSVSGSSDLHKYRMLPRFVVGKTYAMYIPLTCTSKPVVLSGTRYDTGASTEVTANSAGECMAACNTANGSDWPILPGYSNCVMAQYSASTTCKLFSYFPTNETGAVDATAVTYVPTQITEGLYPRFPLSRYVYAMQITARDAVLAAQCMDIRTKPGLCSALDLGELGDDGTSKYEIVPTWCSGFNEKSYNDPGSYYSTTNSASIGPACRSLHDRLLGKVDFYPGLCGTDWWMRYRDGSRVNLQTVFPGMLPECLCGSGSHYNSSDVSDIAAYTLTSSMFEAINDDIYTFVFANGGDNKLCWTPWCTNPYQMGRNESFDTRTHKGCDATT